MPHHVVDKLVAVDVPFVASSGALHGNRKGAEVAGVVGDPAGEHTPGTFGQAACIGMALNVVGFDAHGRVVVDDTRRGDCVGRAVE